MFEKPWARITFAEEMWRAKLAEEIRSHEIDALIAGPLTRLGMDGPGTLQEVRALMELVHDMRQRADRPLTVILVHHENKGGAVSGAWEGAGDTLEDEGGIGAGEKIVKTTLDEHPERIVSRTSEEARAVGRHPSAIVWQVRSGSNAPDAPCAFLGGVEEGAALRPSLKGAAPDEGTPADSPEGALGGSAHPTQLAMSSGSR